MIRLLRLPVTIPAAVIREFREGGLPLLTRELAELSAKKRTYVVRVLYATALFWLGVGALSDQLALMVSTPTTQLGMLGSGEELFRVLLSAQMVTVHIFMPALGCAAITGEKERNTLGLLFITRLGPWRILFEKLFSRLLPMFMCLLLSVPILALAYSFGGLSFNYMVNGIWLLLLTSVQIACLTLMCSSFCRTTTAAFIWAYLAQVILFFGALMISGGGYRSQLVVTALSGGLLWLSEGYGEPLTVSLWGARWIYFSTITFFVAARFFLVRRAAVPSKSHLLAFFRRLDRFFVWLNNRVAKGVVLVNDVASLPEDRPIAWREVTKKSLGTLRYLIRAFLVLEVPTLVICLIAATYVGFESSPALGSLACVLWVLSAIIVSIKGATLIASERSSETLDVLLTTTLTSREIIDQKRAGLRRVTLMVSIPLLTCIGFRMYIEGGLRSPLALSYGLWATIQLLIYLPLMAWLSVWVGLVVRSQTRSIFASVSLLMAWCVLPLVVFFFAELLQLTPRSTGSPRNLVMMLPLLLSGPSTAVALNEFALRTELMRSSFWPFLLAHTVTFTGLVLLIRHKVLSSARRRLGRLETRSEDPPAPRTADPTAALEPSHALS